MDPLDEELWALVPPGTPDAEAWFRDLADTVAVGAPVVDPVGAVAMDEATLNAARSALFDWAQRLPEDDANRRRLAQGFVFWLLRPALRLSTKAGVVVADAPAVPVWGAHTRALTRLVGDWSGSVARLDLSLPDGQRFAAGTAWVVGETATAWVLLTARHVVEDLQAAGWGAGGRTVVADFGVLDGPAVGLQVLPNGRTHPTLDLGRVDLPKDGAPALSPFPLTAAAAGPDEPIVVIGHGLLDSGGFATQVVGFDGVSAVKRASLGFLRGGVEPPPRDMWAGGREHDATTLRGNSGGPVVSLRTASAVGLHVGGVPRADGAWFVTNIALPSAAATLAPLLDGVTMPARGPLWA